MAGVGFGAVGEDRMKGTRMTNPIQADFKVEAYGTFTPPPPPCGNPDCGYEGTELVHADTCEEK